MVGLVSSFLFIVRLPTSAPGIEQVSEVPAGKGVVLFAGSPKKEARIGEEISVSITFKIETPNVNIKNIIFGLKYDQAIIDFVREDGVADSDFASNARILNISENEFIGGWSSVAATEIRPNEMIYLSKVVFRAVGGGTINITPSFGEARKSGMSSVIASDGKNILDGVGGFSLTITK